MAADNVDRTNGLVLAEDLDAILKETGKITAQFLDDGQANLFNGVVEDIKLLFKGEYPGYRSSNTKYHDFEHTLSVVLATARLIHGCLLKGQTFLSRELLLTVIASLLHDVGLIQERNDLEGSGAKYTIGHEERSITFLNEYLPGKGFSAEEIKTCSNFIRCTILSLAPDQIPFSSTEHQKLGHIVGSADLLAQMADRLYLEKLLLLYKEFEEADLPGYHSELDLLKKTKDFFEVVAQKRLNKDLGGVYRHMQAHFKSWMNVDQDFYSEAIKNNITYLESLSLICGDSIACYLENLRRGGIAQKSQASIFTDEKKQKHGSS